MTWITDHWLALALTWLAMNIIVFQLIAIHGIRKTQRLRDCLIDRLIARAQRTPYYHLTGYMERWWLLKWSRFQPISIRIHRIMKSDAGTVMHDHPAGSISIILRGGYFEVMPLDQNQHPAFDQPTAWYEEGFGHGSRTYSIWRKPGQVVIRKAKDRHRIIVPAGKECWSIFIMWRRTNHWGFYPADGFVGYKEWLNIHPDNGVPKAGEEVVARPSGVTVKQPVRRPDPLAAFDAADPLHDIRFAPDREEQVLARHGETLVTQEEYESLLTDARIVETFKEKNLKLHRAAAYAQSVPAPLKPTSRVPSATLTGPSKNPHNIQRSFESRRDHPQPEMLAAWPSPISVITESPPCAHHAIPASPAPDTSSSDSGPSYSGGGGSSDGGGASGDY